MAGDWIKMGKDLLTHPKVVRISSALKADKLRTVGGLFAVWCLFDTHSVDGNLSGYTFETIDDEIRFPGFSAAMESVGWLKSDADGAFLPDFEEHNGQSAKRRAQETERKRNERKVSAPNADKKRTREEKRREDINTPPTPKGDRFDEFWKAWPQNERKQDRRKCESKWKSEDFNAIADRILSDIETKRRTQKWADGYIEAPLVYLNNKRWEDGVVPLSDSQVRQDLDPLAWAKSRSGVITRACELGIGPWDESNAAAGTGPSWPQYRSEVMAADAAQRQGVAA